MPAQPAGRFGVAESACSWNRHALPSLGPGVRGDVVVPARTGVGSRQEPGLFPGPHSLGSRHRRAVVCSTQGHHDTGGTTMHTPGHELDDLEAEPPDADWAAFCDYYDALEEVGDDA